MHERTQLALARLVFVSCCALPTVVTVAIILLTWTPWYHHRVLAGIEQRLSNEFGVSVSIGEYQQVSPNRLMLHDLRLQESETTREVATVRLAKWVTSDSHSHLHLFQPTMQSEQLAAFWRLFHDRFLCQPQHTRGVMRVVVDDLTIQSGDGSMTFRDVDMWMRPMARAVQVTIDGVPAASRDNSPVRLAIVRNRTAKSPVTEWSLQTGTTPLPCSAIADFSPVLEMLGRDAEFYGDVQWQSNGDEWLLDLRGAHFDNIDLSRLFETLPHRLTGTADVSFDRGYIAPGKRIDVHGKILARDGYIGDSLVRRAHQYLQFGVAEESVASQNLPYDRLGMRFNLMQSQLRLSGICAGQPGYESLPDGVVLCADGRPIAWTNSPILPSTNLAETLAPEHSVSVPLAQQTAPMMSLLLPPSRQLPVGEQGSIPRITRSNSWTGQPPIVQPRSNAPQDSGATRPPMIEVPYSLNR